MKELFDCVQHLKSSDKVVVKELQDEEELKLTSEAECSIKQETVRDGGVGGR